jgi:hypothetical protein
MARQVMCGDSSTKLRTSINQASMSKRLSIAMTVTELTSDQRVIAAPKIPGCWLIARPVLFIKPVDT